MRESERKREREKERERERDEKRRRRKTRTRRKWRRLEAVARGSQLDSKFTGWGVNPHALIGHSRRRREEALAPPSRRRLGNGRVTL